MQFDLTNHIAARSENHGLAMIKEACRLIGGCRDPHHRALGMIELRRMQAMFRAMTKGPALAH